MAETPKPRASASAETEKTKRGLVKDHDDYIKKMKESMITPQESLLLSAVIILIGALISLGLLALFSKLNIFTGGIIFALFGYYFYYNCSHGDDILPGEIGVQFMLGNPKKEGSRVYSPGKHGSIYPFWYPKVVSIQQETIAIPEFEVNAAGNVDKIIRMRIPSGSAQIRNWNPWRLLTVVGESILEENGGLVKALQSSMREEATNHTEGELRKDKTKLNEAAEARADELSDPWGIEVIEINLPEIIPVNLKVSESHEQISIEERQRKSEEIEAAGNIEMIKKYKELGMTGIEAAVQHSVERGKSKGREHIVISSGGGNNSGGNGGALDNAAARAGAILGATLGAQLKNKFSPDESNDLGNRKKKRNKWRTRK